ncbi:tropomyosin-like protein [Carex rostrata]
MENGDSANGEALARTLTREDSLYGDAFASPTKGDDSEKIIAIEEEDSASTATETEVLLQRVQEELRRTLLEVEELRRSQMALATEASRLEGEVARLQSDLVTSETATEAAEEELNMHKSKADSLNKALEEAKEKEDKLVVEKEKLIGQMEALKEKLIAYEEEIIGTKQELMGTKQELIETKQELIKTKQHNASLQVEISNHHQSAAQAHQDMAEVLERNVHLEAEISKKTGKEEEDVVVVREMTSSPNWVGNVVAASTGVVATVVVMSLYFRLRKQQ